MLPLKDVVEELSSRAVLEDEEADIVPLPDLLKFDNVRMVLKVTGN